jgi:hypothetical protein
MTIKALLFVATAVAAMSSAPALAVDYSVASGGAPSTRMTYAAPGNVSASLTGGGATGVGAGNSVVNDPVSAVSFYLPSYFEGTSASTYQGTDWWVPAAFSLPTLLTSGNDFALFALTAPALGHSTYDIYTGPYLGDPHVRIGTGTVGGPEGTYTGGLQNDFRQRVGTNMYELFGTAFGWSSDFLLYDFDDGTVAHDAFYQVVDHFLPALAPDYAQTGLVGEASSSPGDSGGPQFIGGQIATVTSFGYSTDDLLSQNCGTDTSVDPYGAGGAHGPSVDQATCTNASVGEIGGDTWLQPHLGDVNAYLLAHPVPEPAVWAQLVLGFGLLGGALRGMRRRLVPARA